MKKLLLLFALFVTVASQAQVKVLGYMMPNAASDNYPTHIDTYGAGGYVSVNSIAERDAITALRRKAGMLVYVAENSSTYQLANNLITWITPNIGGGGGGGGGDSAFYNHVSSSITQEDIDRWNAGTDLSNYYNKQQVDSIMDSRKYWVDGVTIKGDGTFDDPFHVVPFGDTSYPYNQNYYTRAQVDSAIASNFRPDTAVQEIEQVGLNVIRVQKKDRSYDITLAGGGIDSNGNASGTVTSVSVVNANGVRGTVATAFTTPAITLFIDTTKFVTHTQLGDSLNSVRNYINIINGGDTSINNGSTDTTINSGDSVVIGNNVAWYIVNPQATLSELTLVLPSAPRQGQTLEISFGGILNSGNVVGILHIAPNAGQNILATPTYNNIEVRDKLVYKYNSSNKKWYR